MQQPKPKTNQYRGPGDVRAFIMGVVLASKKPPTIGDVISHAQQNDFPTLNICRQALWLVGVHWLNMVDQKLEPTAKAIRYKEEWRERLEELSRKVEQQLPEVNLKPVAPTPTQISTDPNNPCVVLSPGPGLTGQIVIVGDEARKLTSRILEHQAKQFAAAGGQS
jgi:hypothetical protein